MDLTLIYREEMLEHVKNPRNTGVLSNADFIGESVNNSCGDSLKIYLKLKDNKITEVKYEAQACAVATASASILSEQLIGKSIEEAKKITKEAVLENFYNTLTPSREKCAILILDSIKDLKKYEN